MEHVSTGNMYLDRELGGGLPVGTVTALVSSPACQCNPLFYELMGEGKWLYVSTYRSEKVIRRELEGVLMADVRIEHVGTDRPVRNTHTVLEDIDESRNVLIDTLNPLETVDRERRYVRLLNALKEYLYDSGSVALVHTTTHGDSPPQREVTLTVADVVLELDTVVDESSVENHLLVSKFRGKDPVDEIIKLDLGQQLGVDTSRNIA